MITLYTANCTKSNKIFGAPGGCSRAVGRLHCSPCSRTVSILLWQGDLQLSLHLPHKHFHQQTLSSHSALTLLAFAHTSQSCNDETNCSRAEARPSHSIESTQKRRVLPGPVHGQPSWFSCFRATSHPVWKVVSHTAGLPHCRLLVQLQRIRTSQQEQRDVHSKTASAQ